MTDFFPTASDTGVTPSDSLAKAIKYRITDSAVSVSDSLSRTVKHNLPEFAVIQGDALARLALAFRTLSDTAVTPTDSTVRVKFYDYGSAFSHFSSRKWNHAQNANKWSTDAHARFTYTTIVD